MRTIALALLLAIATPTIASLHSDPAIVVPQAKKNQLKKGMTEAEVKKVLGETSNWTMQDKKLILIYPEGTKAFLVTLTGGKVTGWKTGNMPKGAG
jgi:hypothetical protein